MRSDDLQRLIKAAQEAKDYLGSDMTHPIIRGLVEALEPYGGTPTLEEVCARLALMGQNVRYHHSGGGIYCIAVMVNDNDYAALIGDGGGNAWGVDYYALGDTGWDYYESSSLQDYEDDNPPVKEGMTAEEIARALLPYCHRALDECNAPDELRKK